MNHFSTVYILLKLFKLTGIIQDSFRNSNAFQNKTKYVSTIVVSYMYFISSAGSGCVEIFSMGCSQKITLVSQTENPHAIAQNFSSA